MQCKRSFIREDLIAVVGHNFVTQVYKEHRKAQLLSLERSLLPAAQVQLEELFHQAGGEDLPGSLQQLQLQLSESEATDRELELQLEELNKRMKENRVRTGQLQFAVARRTFKFKVRELRDGARRHPFGSDRKAPPKPVEHRDFIQKCPVPECRGFLSAQWVCGICKTHTCRKCGEPKAAADDPAHQCKKEDVETMEFLRKDTKNCPGCGAVIHKIDGCDQMWCTQCKTAFSWKTQQVLNDDRVHNPHYFEWLRQHPEAQAHVHDAGDADCGGVPLLHQAWRNSGTPIVTSEMTRKLQQFLQRLAHHAHVTIPSLARVNDGKFMELRLRFLNREITEAHWKKELMRLKKGAEYEQRVSQVFRMLTNVGSDLIRNYNEHSKQYDAKGKKATDAAAGAQKVVDEVDTLVVYANDQLQRLSKAYDLRGFSV